jgi:hypothetical protein
MTTHTPDLMATDLALRGYLDAIDGVDVFDQGVFTNAGADAGPAENEDGHVRYVVIYSTPGTGWAPALDGQHTAATGAWQLTCVGSTPDECRWVIAQVRKAVSGKQAGETSGLFRETPGTRPPIAPDKDGRPSDRDRPSSRRPA